MGFNRNMEIMSLEPFIKGRLSLVPGRPAEDRGTTDVLIYIVERSSTFFQSVMNGVSTYGATGRAEFRDCENYRVACGTENYDEEGGAFQEEC